MAEGIFRHLAEQAGLEDAFDVESAGTGPWHVGEAPDLRAQQAARAHGIQLDSIAQQFTARDFARLDHVIALDGEVAAQLRSLAPTPADRAKVRLLREFDPHLASARRVDLDVPDPYYGGPADFEATFQIIDRSARGLLTDLQPPQ
jgi:protein-tyrosine phosphatase